MLSQDLQAEIESGGHICVFSKTRDFIFKISDGELSVSTPDIKNLLGFDIYIFRYFSENMANSRIFIEELRSRKKIVIESCISDKYINSKLAEGVRIIKKDLHYPKTYQINNIDNLSSLPDNIFPVIAKPANGARGRDINLIKNRKKLAEFLSKTDEDFLIQEYLRIAWDVRIFVVGNKVLGGMKRYVQKGDCRSNASLGSEVENFELTSETKKVALSAAKTLHYDVAGVDLAWDESKKRWYVIEVNISPQWHAFKRVTGINPAKEIIAYALKKYHKNRS